MDGTGPSPPSDEFEESPQEVAKHKIKEILAEPRLAPVQDEFTRLPIYAMFGGATFFLAMDFALRRGMLSSVRRPTVYKVGSVIVGAVSGLQIGLWRMRSQYHTIDPSGSLRTRLEVLFKAAQGKGPLPPEDHDTLDQHGSNPFAN